MSLRKKNLKNGIVLVADVGIGCEKFFTVIKDCVTRTLKSKIIFESCDDVTVVLCGTEVTHNVLQGPPFRNVNVLAELKAIDWDLVKKTEENFKISEIAGDWVAALTLSTQLLQAKICDRIDYEKTQIVLFSSFPAGAPCSLSLQSKLIKTINELRTELVVVRLGQHLTENNVGQQSPNLESLAVEIIKKVKGTVCNHVDLLAHLIYFQEKSCQSAPWNVTLDVGSDIKLPLTGFVKVKERDHLKWKEQSRIGKPIQNRRTFHKENDESFVREDDVCYAYKYGAEYIPVGNRNQFSKYESGNKSLSLLAFVDGGSVPAHYYNGSSTLYFFAQSRSGIVDHGAQIGLSALIQAMEESKKVALVRRVYQRNSRVQIGVLSPRIRPNYECLIYHELPFAEEFHQFVFPPWQSSNTTPTSDQLKAVDQLIDRFDLSAVEKEGEFAFNLDEAHDPYSQYLFHLVSVRAADPNRPLPGVPPHIRRLTEAPEMLLTKGQNLWEQIKQLYPVPLEASDCNERRIDRPEKTKRERPESCIDSPQKRKRSDTDRTAIDVDRSEQALGTATPILDFQRLLGSNRLRAYQLLEKAILNWLITAGGKKRSVTARCRDCLSAYRQDAIDVGGDYVTHFNDWICRFQKLLPTESSYQEFWTDCVMSFQLGLITAQESSDSVISNAESQSCFELKASPSDSEDGHVSETELTFET